MSENSKRRTSAVGNPMYITLPTEGYDNTGEGGLAFYLVVKAPKRWEDRRQACIAGYVDWPQQDVVLNDDWDNSRKHTYVDAALLIGSTGLSLWSDKKESYFIATYDDLTPSGKLLYDMLEKTYGEGTVSILTLLDT